MPGLSAAFASCVDLTNVTLSDGVQYIGRGAFMGCASLTTVTIGSSVTSIEMLAFSGCSSLTSVTIPDSVSTIENAVFSECTNLTGVYLQGNAPASDLPAFGEDANTIVYYLPGTTGWGTTYSGRPTAPWVRPNPVILKGTTRVQTNALDFRISWATNVPVVVEATTSLSNPNWSPVSTNTLTEGWCDFRDPEWTNYPSRFYRVRQQ